MDKRENLVISRKRTGKFKKFFNGLKCTNHKQLDQHYKSKEFISGVNSISREFANNSNKDKIEKISKYVQTTTIITVSVLTQTFGDSIKLIPLNSVEYFKKAVENNSELHRRDILIENRRLCLTRVVNIVSLKISFNFNYLIFNSQFIPILKQLKNNFILVFTLIISHKLRTLFRSFLNLTVIKSAQKPILPSLPRSKDFVNKKIILLYLCKVVETRFAKRKQSCFSRILNFYPSKYDQIISFKPITNSIRPLDFFLTPLT